MKKNYYLLLVLAFICVNFITAQFNCPELLGNQSTTTLLHFKIDAGTCGDYPSSINVVQNAVFGTYTFASCNGTNLKYDFESGPVSNPLTDINAPFFVDFPLNSICGYIGGVYDPTLSNNDVSLNESISIYPNPLRKDNVLTIKLATNISAKVFMYDVTGKLTVTDEIDNVTRKQINTLALNNGVYFLQIVTDNASVTRKVVIMQ